MRSVKGLSKTEGIFDAGSHVSNPRTRLFMYLSVSDHVVSAVLLRDQGMQ